MWRAKTDETQHVVVQFYPWCVFYFPLFWGMSIMYDNELKIVAKDKIEPQHIHNTHIPALRTPALNTDTSLLRIIFVVPGERKPLHVNFP